MTLARSYWGIGVSWLSGLSRYHGLAKTIIRVKGLHPLASHRISGVSVTVCEFLCTAAIPQCGAGIIHDNTKLYTRPNIKRLIIVHTIIQSYSTRYGKHSLRCDIIVIL